MLHLLGALAEFERALIHERQAEGIAVAKKQGRYRGRKPALSEGQLARARRLVAEGVPKTCLLYTSDAADERYTV